MSLWIIQYTYDSRDDLRERLLDDHQWYLAGLADAGAMIAHGTFDDDESGALLIASAPSADHVDDLIAADPFVVAGAVRKTTVRPWNGQLVPTWRDQSREATAPAAPSG
jgi:uncharacterized protein YciI